jgi:rRNA maturation endonuclease Nob1
MAAAKPTEAGGPCPYCTHALPTGRPVSYCPHCGMNVIVTQCPACSSEVESGWHFCVTCGRDMSTLVTTGAHAKPLTF